jgi:hypothetical protein
VATSGFDPIADLRVVFVAQPTRAASRRSFPPLIALEWIGF